MTKEQFFVGIRNPVMVRRLLLNSSKDVLDALKDYENFEILKEQKAKYVIELKKILDEIMVLNRKLKSNLPKTPLHAPPKYARVARKRKEKIPSKSVKMRRVATKMEALETELSKVEDRLKALE